MTEEHESRKILVLHSSPRKKGNSNTLASEIIKAAEAEGAQVADGSHLTALPGGVVGLGRVLDETQGVLAGDLGEAVQVGGLAGDVDGDDGLGLLGDGRLHRVRIDEVGGPQTKEQENGSRRGHQPENQPAAVFHAALS